MDADSAETVCLTNLEEETSKRLSTDMMKVDETNRYMFTPAGSLFRKRFQISRFFFSCLMRGQLSF